MCIHRTATLHLRTEMQPNNNEEREENESTQHQSLYVPVFMFVCLTVDTRMTLNVIYKVGVFIQTIFDCIHSGVFMDAVLFFKHELFVIRFYHLRMESRSVIVDSMKHIIEGAQNANKTDSDRDGCLTFLQRNSNTVALRSYGKMFIISCMVRWSSHMWHRKNIYFVSYEMRAAFCSILYFSWKPHS